MDSIYENNLFYSYFRRTQYDLVIQGLLKEYPHLAVGLDAASAMVSNTEIYGNLYVYVYWDISIFSPIYMPVHIWICIYIFMDIYFLYFCLF